MFLLKPASHWCRHLVLDCSCSVPVQKIRSLTGLCCLTSGPIKNQGRRSCFRCCSWPFQERFRLLRCCWRTYELKGPEPPLHRLVSPSRTAPSTRLDTENKRGKSFQTLSVFPHFAVFQPWGMNYEVKHFFPLLCLRPYMWRSEIPAQIVWKTPSTLLLHMEVPNSENMPWPHLCISGQQWCVANKEAAWAVAFTCRRRSESE